MGGYMRWTSKEILEQLYNEKASMHSIFYIHKFPHAKSIFCHAPKRFGDDLRLGGPPYSFLFTLSFH
jgi:hypothetical protein